MKERSRFRKQFLAMVLTAALIAGQTTIPAFADEPETSELTEVSESPGAEGNIAEGETVPEAEPEDTSVSGDAAVDPENVSVVEADNEIEEPSGEVAGSGTADDPWVVSTWAELKDKMTSDGHIKLNDNVSPEDPENSGCLEVPTSAVVTLDLNGKTIDRGLAEMEPVKKGNVIIVSGNLTLMDSCEDKTGIITGGNPISSYGGGVRVDENGTFTMDGGIISGNQTQDGYSGGGVYVDENGTFTMNEGAICNNKAHDGGGVCINYADFTMNGGTICHNRAHGNQYNNGQGGGISVVGRQDKSARFTMNGGAINNNTADVVGGGMYIDHAGFSMTDGEIVGNKLSNEGRTRIGGGIFVNANPSDQTASFVMSGGRICGNSADRGGGVMVNSGGTFTMTGGVISENSVTQGDSHNGGGVFVSGGTFNVSGSPVIINNTKGSEANNVEFGSYDEYINVTGTLTEIAELSVWGVEDNRMIAQGSGYTIKDTDAARFFSDGGRCFVELDQDKVVLKIKTTWAGLQSLLDNASHDSNEPTKIKMNCDATASENDAGLVMDDYTFVKLDLNGHTIDRGLAGKHSVDNGYVIKVGPSASLTVSDSSESQKGTITGGNNTGEGGGVCMDQTPGTFNLTGGSIKGNNAVYGGGVFVTSGQCNISGTARIEGNSCFDMYGSPGLGGGVVVYTGWLSLQDNPVIRDNVRNGTWDSTQGKYTGPSKSNLYLSNGNGTSQRKIELSAPLTSGASIGVTLDTPRVFTDNWNSIMGNANPAGFFTSDDSRYSVSLQDGEAVLASHIHNFTYTSNGATITATCSNSDGNCPLEGHKASITIKAPYDLTYDGNEKPAEIYGDRDILGTPVIAYKRGDTPWGDAPKCAENAAYTASVTLEGVTASVSYTIEKKPVTITGLSAENKIYDGDTGAVVKGTPSVNGVIDADSRFVIVSPGRAAFTDPNAGTGKTVKFSGWSIDGESAFNYKLSSQPADVTADIEKAPQADIEVQGTARYGTEGTVELKDVIKAGGNPGTVSISSDEASVLDGTPVITDGTKLSFKFKDVSGNVGKKAIVTVSVNEASNYEDYKIAATLEVIECEHLHKVLIEGTTRKATCTEQGYTGDYECSECHSRLKGEYTPIDPENHSFEKVEVVKPATTITKGETKYRCSRCHKEKIVADIPCIEDGKDYEDLRKDVEDLSGNAAPVIEPVKDDKGNEVGETVKIGGEEVSKTVRDPESGKETVESKVWIAGLKEAYRYTGSAIKPSFHVYDGTRKLTEGTDYTVKWDKNKDAGTAAVTVKFKGNYKGSDSETVNFKIDPAVLGEDIIAHEIGIAAKKKGSVKVTPVLTWAQTGKFVSSKYFDITPSSVTGEGTTEAAVTVKSGQNNFTGSAKVLIKAVADKNKMLSNAKVKFDQKSYPYTGGEIIPKYELTLGGKKLAEGTDYKRVSLCNNTNPGTATVVFEALSGNSAGIVGSKTTTFKISGKKELKEGASFTFTCPDSVPYAKGGAKPSVAVTDNDNHVTLKEGKDYTLSYSKNKSVTNGAKTAEVKVKGKGDYKGSVTLKYAIAQQSLKAGGISIVASDQFTTKAKLKALKITITDIDGKKLKAGTDYTVGTPDTSDPSNTDTKGIVKVTVTGKGAYRDEAVTVSYRYEDKTSDISKAKAVKKIEDQTFTGYAVKLSNAELTGVLTAKDAAGADVSLIPGTHFKVTGYSNNVKKGTAKVKIQGIGDFAGTKTISFKIIQRPVDYKGALIGEGWK